MSKTKPAIKKKSTRPVRASTRAAKPKPRAKPAVRKPNQVIKPVTPQETYTTEYLDYLERYAIGGAGRPRLTPGEFDQLDEEMLDLLAVEAERGLNDEQTIRLQELEFLLLDSE